MQVEQLKLEQMEQQKQVEEIKSMIQQFRDVKQKIITNEMKVTNKIKAVMNEKIQNIQIVKNKMIASLQNKLQNYEDDLNNTKMKLMQENSNSDSIIQELHRGISRIRIVAEIERKQSFQSRSQVEDCKGEIHALTQSLDTLRHEASESETTIHRYICDKTELQARLQYSIDNCDIITEKGVKEREELEQKIQTITLAYTSNLREKDESLETLKNIHNTSLHLIGDQIRKELTKVKNQSETMFRCFEEYTEDQKKQAYALYKQHHDTIEEQLQRHRQENDSLSARNASLLTRLQHLESIHLSMKGDIEGKQWTISKQMKKMEEMSDQYNQSLDEKSQNVTLLLNELAQQIQSRIEYETAIKRLRDHVLHLDKSMETSQMQVSQMKSRWDEDIQKLEKSLYDEQNAKCQLHQRLEFVRNQWKHGKEIIIRIDKQVRRRGTRNFFFLRVPNSCKLPD